MAPPTQPTNKERKTMANVFIYTPEGSSVPTLADRDANRLITQLADLFGQPAPASIEDVERTAEDLKASLFTQVATGEVAAEDAAAMLKSIEQQTAEARRAAKEEPPIMRLNDEPATLTDVKRAFRGAQSGTFVRVDALEGDNGGTITMFRL